MKDKLKSKIAPVNFRLSLDGSHAGSAGKTRRGGDDSVRSVNLPSSPSFLDLPDSTLVAAQPSQGQVVDMERDLHVMLVSEVEKHECLYNSTLPEYAMKKETDEAWSEISKNMKLSVAECKDKWRNIRSTFRRSFKPSRNAKPKRTYYLSRYLNFIIPYSKPMEDSIFQEDPGGQDNDSTVTIKEEDSGNSTHGDDELPTSSQPQLSWQESEDAEDIQLDAKSPSELHSRLRSHRLSSEEDFSVPEHLRTEPNPDSRIPPYYNDKEHMKYFFLSLLPEFGSMSEQQTRTFKIKVLQLIDDIKTGNSS